MKGKQKSNLVMREWKVTYWTKEDNPAIPDIETLRFKPENAVVDALTFTPQDSSSLDGVIVPAKDCVRNKKSDESENNL